MKKIVFSGIQPSGNLHIGNYIGAMKQWVTMQDDYESIFCIVDLHAITVPQDPQVLRQKVREVAALYIASGIDPEKSHIFVQSENPDHTYLAWIFDCIAPFGQMQRMTQFKDKSNKQKENTTVGLFNYPALMAADILLYNTDEVPVGEDQKQHIELTRDLAEKFNSRFGETFKLPEPRIESEHARVMSLQDPSSKMSKSDTNQNGTIHLLDELEIVRSKIKRAVTDSGNEIKSGADKPAMTNLLNIYEAVSGKPVSKLEQQYAGVGYGQFKDDLAEATVEFLKKIQKRYHEVRNDEAYLDSVLDTGSAYARGISSERIQQVNQIVGLGRR